MCDVLGLSSSVPTDLRSSLAGFMNTRGEVKKNGWGLAAYPQSGALLLPPVARVVREAQPMDAGPMAQRLLEGGAPDLGQGSAIYLLQAGSPSGSPETPENTQPFERPVWDRTFVFVHDGRAVTQSVSRKSTFSPRGQTDSEKLFCEILDVLATRFPNGASWGKLHVAARCTALHQAIKSVAPPAAGDVNVLISDGEVLFCHSRHQSKNSYFLLRGPGSIPPAKSPATERSALVVTGEPLTAEPGWQIIPRGESIAFRRSEVVYQSFRSVSGSPPKPLALSSR